MVIISCTSGGDDLNNRRSYTSEMASIIRRETRSARPRKRSVLHARYVSNPSSRSMLDWAWIRADVNRRCLKCSARAIFSCVENVVTVRMAWNRTGRSWRSCEAVVSRGRTMKGKYGSMRDRKKSRCSSACHGDGSESSGLRWSCSFGGVAVGGVRFSMMDWAGIPPAEPDVVPRAGKEIFSLPRIWAIVPDGPEESAMDCTADSSDSILPSSWAIRTSDSSAL